MAGSGDSKSISFKFDIDETSFANAKLKIIDLTKLLTDLAKVAGGISMPTGAGGAGGNFLSGVGVTTQKSVGLPTGAGGVQKSNNVAGILTQGLQVDAGLFKTIASGSKDALNAMTTALKSASERQIQDIKRLKSEIDSLAKSYNTLQNTPGGAGSSLADADMAQIHVKARQQQKLEQEQAVTNNLNRGTGQWATAYTQGAGMVTAAVGGFMGGFNMAQQPGNITRNFIGTNAAEQAGLPLFALQQGAGVGSALGGIGAGISKGDLASARAFRTLTENGTLNKIAGVSKTWLGIANANQNYQNVTGELGAAMGSYGAEMDGLGPRALSKVHSATEWAEAKGRASINRQTAEAMANAVAAERGRDPLTSQRINDWFGGLQGDLNLERAGRTPGRTWVDATGQTHYQSGAGRLKLRASNMGIDGGTLAGAIQAAGAETGIANSSMGASFWASGVGGFQGAASVFNIGQQFEPANGKMGGRSFYDAARGRGGISGTGGLDPVVGSQVAQLIAKQMTSSGFGVGGEGALRGMGAMISGIAGNDVGLQMRMAREAQTGDTVRASQLSGGTDPLQGMINAYAGVSTFGSNYAAASAMGKLTPTDMNQMLRSGKVSDSLADVGIGIDDVRKYAATSGEFALSRTSDAMFGGADTPAGRAISAARAGGGDPLSYIAQSGLKNKKLAALFRQMGGGIAAGSGLTQTEETSALFNRASADKSLFPDLAGSGVGDILSKGDLGRAGVRAQGTVEQQKYKSVEGQVDQIIGDMQGLTTFPDELRKMGEGVMAGEKTLETAFQALADFIYTKILKTKNPNNDKPPTTAAPKSKDDGKNPGDPGFNWNTE